ncbi:hypothetical protein AVEN_6648-1 [Araneus ventricosus]|uniref:Uncharacterized protein n=1 Tax=Araneus ventricosus TaxID=182803 RepID=A0A4Y2H3U6_ARAVE|nr:hypothetical protein AVEN_6648-1 [Araneus ventricosus]
MGYLEIQCRISLCPASAETRRGIDSTSRGIDSTSHGIDSTSRGKYNRRNSNFTVKIWSQGDRPKSGKEENDLWSSHFTESW